MVANLHSGPYSPDNASRSPQPWIYSCINVSNPPITKEVIQSPPFNQRLIMDINLIVSIITSQYCVKYIMNIDSDVTIIVYGIELEII